MKNWKEIWTFWFGIDPEEEVDLRNSKLWFKKDPQLDEQIRQQFLPIWEELKENGANPDWAADPRSYLSQILVIDQFSRNMFRGNPQSFELDPLGQKLSLEGIQEGLDRRLSFVARSFFYLPLQHSEDRSVQERSIQVYQQWVEDAPDQFQDFAKGTLGYAYAHQKIINEFGRFPHRNAVLGRTNTKEEETYLSQPGAGF